MEQRRSEGKAVDQMIKSRNGYSEYVASYLFYVLISFVAFRQLLITPGTLGLSHDWSFPPYAWQVSRLWNFIRWSVTSDGLEMFFFGYPGVIPQILLANLGVSGEYLSKTFTWFAFSLSGFAMFTLCRSMGIRPLPATVGGIVYMFSPMPFNRIGAGHIYHLLGFAFAPLAIAFYRKSLASATIGGRVRTSIICGLFLALVSSQYQVGMLAYLVLLAYTFTWCVADGWLKNRAAFLHHLLSLTLVTAVAFSAYQPWFLPKMVDFVSLVGRGAEQFTSKASVAWQFNFGGASALSAITLRVNLLTYFQAAIGSSIGFAWELAALVIAIASLSTATVTGRFRRDALCLGALSLPFIFLSVGSSVWYVEKAWEFLVHFFRPAVALIGEFENLLYIPTLGYGVLAAIFAYELLGKAPSVSATFSKNRQKAGISFLVILLVVYSYPSLTQFPNITQNFRTDPAYEKVYRWIDTQPGQFRVLWTPVVGEFTLSRPGLRLGGYDPIVDERYNPKPTFPQFMGTYSAFGIYPQESTQWIRFLMASFYEPRTSYLGYLLGLTGVKYLLVRSDAEAKYLPQIGLVEEQALRVIGSQRDIRPVNEIGPVKIFENSHFRPLLDLAGNENVGLLVGSLSSLVTLSYASSETNIVPSKTIVFFPSMSQVEVEPFPLNDVIMSATDFYDLVFSFLPRNHLFYPADHTEGSGWGQMYFPTRWALISEVHPAVINIGKANAEMQFDFESTRGTHDIWARFLMSKNSRAISFRIDNRPVVSLGTQSQSGEYFSWKKIGTYDLPAGDHKVRIVGQAFDQEAISAILVSPTGQVRAAVEKARSYLHERHVAVMLELDRVEGGDGYEVVDLGTEASQGSAISSTGRGQAEYRLYLPREGEYVAKIRIKSSNTDQVSLRLISEESRSVEAHQNVSVGPSTNFVWYDVKFGHLREGWNLMKLSWLKQGFTFDMIVLAPPAKMGSSEPGYRVAELGQTRYEIETGNRTSFFVVRRQPFSEHWELTDGLRNYASLPANVVGQSYYVDKAQGKLALEYSKQKLFEVGWIVTISAYLGWSSILTMAYLRDRRR